MGVATGAIDTSPASGVVTAIKVEVDEDGASSPPKPLLMLPAARSRDDDGVHVDHLPESISSSTQHSCSMLKSLAPQSDKSDNGSAPKLR